MADMFGQRFDSAQLHNERVSILKSIAYPFVFNIGSKKVSKNLFTLNKKGSVETPPEFVK